MRNQTVRTFRITPPLKLIKIRPLIHKLLRRAQDNTKAIPSFRWMKYGFLKTAFMWMYENNHRMSQACQMRLTKPDLTATCSDHSHTEYQHQTFQEHVY